jgi:hypothetical protein
MLCGSIKIVDRSIFMRLSDEKRRIDPRIFWGDPKINFERLFF